MQKVKSISTLPKFLKVGAYVHLSTSAGIVPPVRIPSRQFELTGSR